MMESLVKQKIDSIAECLFAKIRKKEEISLGLYSGEFGILLFLLYYSKYTQEDKHVMFTERYAEQLLNQLMQRTYVHTFCSGFSGILYLFDFLRENDFIEIDVNNNQPALDNYLISHMRQDFHLQRYDFMHGALGVGLYFLKKGDSNEYIQELIDFLYDTAEKDIDNHVFKWKTMISQEDNYIGYNPSLSHGVSSIIIFLSRAINNGKRDDKIIEMLFGAVNYILSLQKDIAQFGSFFPHFTITNSPIPEIKSRLAWCF